MTDNTTPTKGKVLIVEDDSFLSSLLKTRVQNDGYEVFLASDGDAAWEFLKKEKPDLIFLDVILHKKSGFDLLEALQSDPEVKNIPIIIISNLGQDADISRGKELGAVDYFVKARVSVDDLVKKIGEYIKK